MEGKLQLTRALLSQAKTPRELIEMKEVQENWVKTFNKVSGSNQGMLRYEAEKVLFLQAIMGNKKFEKVSMPSLFGAWTELSISGLTLREGIAYIVPYGEKAQFIPGWKGRLEQINEMPNVVFTHEPQVVYSCDDFEFERGEKTKILKHKPARNRTDDDKIEYVYFVIEFKHGVVTFLMEAKDVYSIRDRFSESYKYYVKHKGQYSNGDKMDPPMWISDEAQAFKKTIVKRVYNGLPKLPKHKYLDERLSVQAATLGVDVDAVDDEETENVDFEGMTNVEDDVSEDPKPGNAPADNPPPVQQTKPVDPVKINPELVTQKSIDEKFKTQLAQEKKPDPKSAPVQATKKVNEDIPSETGF